MVMADPRADRLEHQEIRLFSMDSASLTRPAGPTRAKPVAWIQTTDIELGQTPLVRVVFGGRNAALFRTHRRDPVRGHLGRARRLVGALPDPLRSGPGTLPRRHLGHASDEAQPAPELPDPRQYPLHTGDDPAGDSPVLPRKRSRRHAL